MDLKLCPEYSDSEAPISIFTEILAEKDPLKFKQISNEFKLLGFEKVKDLANITLTQASQMYFLGGDPIVELSKAKENYDEYRDNQFKFARSEYDQNNFVKTQEICKEMLLHKHSDIKFLILLSASYFCCEDYDRTRKYLLKAYEVNPNNMDVFINFTFFLNNSLFRAGKE